jgi:enoyl-CoA hydratase
MEENVEFEDIRAEYRFVTAEIDDEGIAWLVIDRQKALNALNSDVIEELRDAVADLADREDVYALVLTGAGEKAFVAGADIAEMAELTPFEARALSRAGQDLMALIEGSPVPVLAMINGFALGGGLELALACHLRVASADARMGLPEVSLGLIPGFAGTQRLARIAGPAVAREWILTGDHFGAEEALRVGVVNRVVPAAELREATAKLARTIARRGPVAVATALEVIRRGMEVGQTEGENLESDAFGLLFSTEDQREGARAFLDKRKPEFRGF